jgi:restriction endonuclease Mrr
MEEMNGLTMSQDSPAVETTEAPEVHEVQGTEITDANPKKSKTKEFSDRINEIRRKTREEEALRYSGQISKLKEDINSYKDKLYRYQAEEQGITVEELKAEEARRNNEFEQQMRNHPEFKQLLERDFEYRKHETLTELQNAFPEENIETIDNLDPQFFKMLQAGVSPVNAYRAAVVGGRKAKPPTTASVKSEPETEGGFYTDEQIRNMSRNEILKNYDKVMKSLNKRR